MKFLIILLVFIFYTPLGVYSFAQNEEYSGTQKFLQGVGMEYDTEGNGFDIEYFLEGQLHNFVMVDSSAKTITFEYDSKGIAEDVLIIYLPIQLIERPLAVYINGDQEPNSIRTMIGNMTQMIIPLYEDSKTITIKGANVISKESTHSEQIKNEVHELQQNKVKTLYNVGGEFSETGFKIDYILSTELSPEVKIDTERNTLIFTINGQIKENEELVFLALPKDLINEPILVEVDGVKEPDTIRTIRGEETKLTIPIKSGAKEISIKGVSVIPEFGSITTLILVLSIISIVVLTSTKKITGLSFR